MKRHDIMRDWDTSSPRARVIAAAGMAVGLSILVGSAPLSAADGREIGSVYIAPLEDSGNPELKVGDKAPPFSLKDLSDKPVDLATYLRDSKIIVIEWFNPECDWVAARHKDHRTMAQTYKKFRGEGVVWLAINSQADGPAADPDRNRKASKEWGVEYPILRDLDGRVAEAYGARATPQFFIIDREGRIAYTGAPDDGVSAADKGTRNFIDEALTRLVAGETIEVKSFTPRGCPISADNKK
jgi:peroxiredoxin